MQTPLSSFFSKQVFFMSIYNVIPALITYTPKESIIEAVIMILILKSPTHLLQVIVSNLYDPRL